MFPSPKAACPGGIARGNNAEAPGNLPSSGRVLSSKKRFAPTALPGNPHFAAAASRRITRQVAPAQVSSPAAAKPACAKKASVPGAA